VTNTGSDTPAHETAPPAGAGRPREIARAQDQLFRQPGGARAKYSALIIGRPGLGALLKYEFVVLVAQPVPGALGLALRKTMYRWLLGSCGRNVVFGQNVVLRHPHKIHIADNVVIDDGCLLDAKGTENQGIRIGSGVFIGRNSILSCKNGDITLEDGANVGFNCEIFSAGDVRVGKDTLMAAYSYLVGGDHDFSDRSIAVNEQPRKAQGIRVGAGVWIGTRATVLDGVTIGDRAIVGAHAVVRQAVPAAATAAGVPARIISGGDAT
jgi:acetyltransferase-like isoleucine patch superfamily enzyme